MDSENLTAGAAGLSRQSSAVKAAVQDSASFDPAASRAVAQSIAQKLSTSTRALLQKYQGGPDATLPQALADDLNRIVQHESIYDPKVFTGVPLPKLVQTLIAQEPQGADLVDLNVKLVAGAFPSALAAAATSWRVNLEGVDFQANCRVYANGHPLGPEAAIDLEKPGVLSFNLRSPAYRAGQVISVVVSYPEAEAPSEAATIHLPESAIPPRLGGNVKTTEPPTKIAAAAPQITQSNTIGPLFSPASIINLDSLVFELKTLTKLPNLSAYIWTRLAPRSEQLLQSHPNTLVSELATALTDEFNRIIQSGPLFEGSRFTGVALSQATSDLLLQHPSGAELVRLNIMLLLDAYKEWLSAQPLFWSVILHGANFRPDSSVYVSGTLVQGAGTSNGDQIGFLNAGALSVNLSQTNHPPGTTWLAVLNSEPVGGLSSEQGLTLDPAFPSPTGSMAPSSIARANHPKIVSAEVEKTISSDEGVFTGWLVTVHATNIRTNSLVYLSGSALSGDEKPFSTNKEVLLFRLSLSNHSAGKYVVAILNPEPEGGLSQALEIELIGA